ncbi:TIGR01621 family pseudouridine synthase [Litorilituus lipolyticus]|uniref:TIGR01621 family pseudouridine synthase n=1 Tax=Litorilituus lipolyticus TaxID=2491017 RepID=A0A502L3H0_9GAMM|nr:TIGR01621 family pseudouridine synthase [Litorilituus lipolyticus]TPH16603.1 TIGR01621 family pseudouridine synthase [Litorilituus lipolyticus]
MFKIIAQHDDFIVVNKAPDVNFHDEGEHGSGLFSLVKTALKTDDLYPVHRLDKMTSGLIIFAKSLSCAQQFGSLFEQHDIEKYYLALSDKKPTKKQGLIKGDMSKSRRGSWKLLRSHKNPAISQFFSFNVMPKVRLFVLKPHTGKTHQLRVALNSISSPILGDKQYAGTPSDRGYLHAFALRFTYQGERFEFIAKPNEGELFQQPQVQEEITKILKPWQLNWPKL